MLHTSCYFLHNNEEITRAKPLVFSNIPQRARKIKKSSSKKLVKSNKSILRFFFQIPFFAISNMVKNRSLKWEKLPKMQLQEKKLFI